VIRPEARAALWHWREVIGAGALALAGMWLIALGGFVLIPAGALAILLSLGLATLGYRRLRFAQDGSAPGVVDVDEGQISYFGPAFGGAVAIPDLMELRLITAGGRRMWRLKQTDGQALLIPIEAVGADKLFDAFSALPGLNSQTLVAALEPASTQTAGTSISVSPDSRVIWRRPARAALT
jgi:hypothetical protein